jgi:hypothetical protein
MNSNQIFQEQLEKFNLNFLEFQNCPLPSQDKDKTCETCARVQDLILFDTPEFPVFEHFLFKFW